MPLLPLRWADVAVVRLLLQHRAKVEPLGREGETPVHLASLMGHSEVLELLLQARASPNTLAFDGKGVGVTQVNLVD
eukprot:symbB.v1.2.011745.t1/scaffold796.1/size162622/4